MNVHPSSWSWRLASVRLKDLFRLYEMTELNQSFEVEEPAKPEASRARYWHHSKKRAALEKAIWKDIEQTCQRIWGPQSEPDFPWVCMSKEIGGYMDHWESDLEFMSCSPQRQNSYGRVEKESFADDASDGEFDM